MGLPPNLCHGVGLRHRQTVLMNKLDQWICSHHFRRGAGGAHGGREFLVVYVVRVATDATSDATAKEYDSTISIYL